MTTPSEAITLLRMLGSGVVPTDRAPSPTDARSLDFAALLDKARGGEIRSGLTVSVDPDLNLTLAQEKIEMLSQIADAAQAQGMDRVLVLDGAEKLVLDVERRVVSDRIPSFDGELMTGFDAVVQLSGSGQTSGDAAVVEAETPLSGDRLLRLLKSLASSALS